MVDLYFQADGTSFYDFMKALSKVFPKEMGELTASQYRRTTGLKNETLTLAPKSRELRKI